MKKFKILALLLAAVLLIGGCGTTGTGEAATEPAADDSGASAGEEGSGEETSSATQVVRVNLESEPNSLNSTQVYDVVSMNVLRHTVEGLMKLDDNNEAIAGIAESWDISDDGLVYTFHLRDAKWANGEDVTANDFYFAWKILLDPEGGALFAYLAYDIVGAQEYNTGEAGEDALGIKVIDDKTLEVTLTTPIPYFLFLCSQTSFYPINEDFYNEATADGADLYGTDADKVMGNGPFVVSEWNHESNIVLTKNENYYDADNVVLDEIDMAMVENGDSAYNMFIAGELDMVSLNTGDQIALAEQDGYEVLYKSNGSTGYLEFNSNNEVLNNKNIRKALTYAIDRQSIIDNVLQDASTPATSFTNPDILASDGTSFQAKLGVLVEDNNVEAAKEALAAGLEELGISELPVITMTVSDTDSDQIYAAAFKQMWEENLGVTVEIQSMPSNLKWDAIESGDFEICTSAWGPDYNDPMTFLDVYTSTSTMSYAGYASAEYDELINAAKTETDTDKRTEFLIEAETLLMDDLPLCPVDFQYQAYVVKDNLKNVCRTSFQDMDLVYAYME